MDKKNEDETGKHEQHSNRNVEPNKDKKQIKEEEKMHQRKADLSRKPREPDKKKIYERHKDRKHTKEERISKMEKKMADKKRIEEARKRKKIEIKSDDQVIIKGKGSLKVISKVKGKTTDISKIKKTETITRYDSIMQELESETESESSISYIRMRHKMTEGPVIIYFYQQADDLGKEHTIPIKLPLENVTTTKVTKEFTVYRKWKELTSEEKSQQLKESDDDNSEDACSGYKDQKLYPVIRMVPVIQIHGTVSIKKKNSKGNVIEEIHEAGFEFPEEYKDSLPNMGGVYDDSYWEECDPITLEQKKGAVDNSQQFDFVWSGARIVKLQEDKTFPIRKIAPIMKKPRKQAVKDRELLVQLCNKYLIYCKIMAGLRKRNEKLISDLINSKKPDVIEEIENKQRRRKVFLKHIMQYINTRDKFATIINLNTHIMDEECKQFDESEKQVKIRLKQLTQAENDLLNKMDIIEKHEGGKLNKEILNHLFRIKLEKITKLKDSHTDYLRELHKLQHSKCNREIVMGKKLDLDDLHELSNKKKVLEKDCLKSTQLIDGALKSKDKMKEILLSFDEKEKLIEINEAVTLDDVSDTEERQIWLNYGDTPPGIRKKKAKWQSKKTKEKR